MALTKKQRMILDAILFLMRKGEIPTVREVGDIVGLRSSATVAKHLKALEAEGLISISGKSRGIRLTSPELLEHLASTGPAESGLTQAGSTGDQKIESIKTLRLSSDSKLTGGKAASRKEAGDEPSDVDRILRAHFAQVRGKGASFSPGAGVPVMGAIAAGHPIETKSEQYSPGASPDGQQPNLALDPRMFAESGEIFALRIEGDSMVDVGIIDGDYAIIRRQTIVEQGEIAAVLIDGQATLKRWHFSEGDSNSEAFPPEETQLQRRSTRPSGMLAADSSSANNSSANNSSANNSSANNSFIEEQVSERRVRLEAENEQFDPLEITESDRKEVMVVGKYIGLVRGVRIV